LQVEAQAELQNLTPRAIRTLAALLTHKSGYIRLDAAKEVLNRNAVGTDKNKSNTQPLLISIQIGDRTLGAAGAAEMPAGALEGEAQRSGAEPASLPALQSKALGNPTVSAASTEHGGTAGAGGRERSAASGSERNAGEISTTASQVLDWDLD